MSKDKRASVTAPRLYTIPPDIPFLDILAQSVLNGDLPLACGTPPGKIELTRWTILLPTRRAARALSEAFLRISGDTAMLLPHIQPLGDVDEDALTLSPAPEIGSNNDLALSLPPAIGAMERRLALTKLILSWSRLNAEQAKDEGFRTRATPAQASSLAVQLGALMDTLDTEQVDLGKLEKFVPDQYADHWQMTLDFLKIVTEHWPAHLKEQGVMAPYARRDKLMQAETEKLVSSPPAAPVIAAGSTGTVPATAALLEAVAMLPNGAVVLPGLDMELDEESWEQIAEPVPHPEHPQFGMNQFLARIGITRSDVIALGSGGAEDRTQLLSQALRPAGTTEKWLEFAKDADRDAIAQTLKGVARINAPTEQDEAEVISLLLRHAVDQPGRVAALVTPDRTLARRVSVRLEKWGLRVDDSAGKPLDKTQPGSFMDALAEAAGSGFAPVPLLALLKHPLTRLGRAPGDMRRVARHLELAAFRQAATGKGLSAHRNAVEKIQLQLKNKKRVHPALKRFKADDWKAIEKLLDDLETAVRPLGDKFAHQGGECPLGDLVRAHVQAGEAFASDEEASSATLWRGEAGEALATLFESLLAVEGVGLDISPGDYPDLYRSFVAGISVRPRAPTHPRIHIWGPLEARLQRPDMAVLGGLNEGVWPATPETDPWLSRPMRAGLDLPAPERRIGLSAHDVAQLMGVGEVYLTRAEKVGGAPTVPSRWLLRLDAVLDALDLQKELMPADPWLAWARARDAVDEVVPVNAPAPCPPLEARPTRLSVTRIEAWIANPYAIFARDILKLTRLDELASEPNAALRGTLVHDALMRFTQAHPDKLPTDIAAELMRHANILFAEFGDQARIEAFWRGQLAVFSRWFAATEPARREGVDKVLAEVRGELTLDGGDGFTLSAVADRIDTREDGTLAIYDYKTGSVPSATNIDKILFPQLPLEAGIAHAGGFEGLQATQVSRLAYIRARGYGEGGEECDASKTLSPNDLATEALEYLKNLILAYANEEQPYKALRRENFKNFNQYRYDSYAHLARLQEWQAGGGEE
jgi:ATP-dependent helicase/nuclease subunit B